MFEKTYEILTAPTPATSPEDNAAQATQALRSLLDSSKCDETLYQKLLEDYPVLVPGTYPASNAG